MSLESRGGPRNDTKTQKGSMKRLFAAHIESKSRGADASDSMIDRFSILFVGLVSIRGQIVVQILLEAIHSTWSNRRHCNLLQQFRDHLSGRRSMPRSTSRNQKHGTPAGPPDQGTILSPCETMILRNEANRPSRRALIKAGAGVLIQRSRAAKTRNEAKREAWHFTKPSQIDDRDADSVRAVSHRNQGRFLNRR